MPAVSKIGLEHLSRRAYIYVRQSSMGQVLSHPESARRQRGLVKLAGELGWSPSQIIVLDEDQGKSATTSNGREAFKRIVGDVSVGEAGVVIGLEIARLARNCADFFPLIEMCALTRTLIADEEGVYNPNEPNDRLVLGVKGTLSEAESHMIRARLHGARWSLARRGELRRKIPAGYVWDEKRRVVKDPDERIRTAFDTFFRRFDEVGSACGLARRYDSDGLLFPTRDFRGPWDGRVEWRPLTVRHANLVLHNPTYAGVYCYGERRTVTQLDPETKSRKNVSLHKPLDSIEVLIQDALSAYISWEHFLANQQRLKENRNVSEGGRGAVRSGAGLLQGIVHCSRCGRRMSLVYESRQYAFYQCKQQTSLGKDVFCYMVSAARIDAWVAERILDAVRPLGIEAALAAIDELERRSQEIRKQWDQRIEQAEYEASLARRRYEQVDPANRLVAANLEGDWEDRLKDLEELRQEYAARAQKPPMRITVEDRARLRELARDLPRLWRAKTTKQEDRKKVLRMLIQDVWLDKDRTSRTVQIRIHWKTGAVTEGRVDLRPADAAVFKTPPATVERIRQLLADAKKLKAIAVQLNEEGLRTGRDKEFTETRVRSMVRRYELRSRIEDDDRPPCNHPSQEI
ncbi:MAG: recombinase family protein [Acidobacteriota bacterium]|jgi:DNA invertase Pin-like site-specific DNA recombinase